MVLTWCTCHQMDDQIHVFVFATFHSIHQLYIIKHLQLFLLHCHFGGDVMVSHTVDAPHIWGGFLRLVLLSANGPNCDTLHLFLQCLHHQSIIEDLTELV